MFTAAEIAEHQEDAESRMVDTCRVTRPADVDPDNRDIDPVTLAYVDPDPVVVYEGKCRLGSLSRAGMAAVSQASSGDAAWDLQDSVLHLPLSAATENVAPGQTVEYLTSTANPGLVGREFGVIGVLAGTQITARRCRVREVVAD